MAEGQSSQRILSGQQIQRTTSIIAAMFVISAVIGVLRQAIITSKFGASGELDAFWAAYRIPEMLFTLIAGGALGSAFIPIFGRFLTNEDHEGAWRLASAVMTTVAIIGSLLAIAAALLAPFITSQILIPAASPEQQALCASLMRVMLCTVVIFGLSGLVMGILNTHQHFLTPALAPSMNNIGLIFGALFLAPRLGIYGLAFGAVGGALLHLGIQIPALLSIQPKLKVLPDLRVPGVSEVLLLMGPRVLGQGVVQINFVVNTALASGMASGSITALNVAFGLMFTVLGVLGQSVGTAVFPSLAALGAKQDMDGFRQTLSGAARSVIFLSLPATVGIVILANPLIATIAQRGQWTAEDTIATAWALRFFAVGLVGFSLQEVLARAFYALRDTMTPVLIAVGGVALNIILSLLLLHVIQGRQFAFGRFTDPFTTMALWVRPAGEGPFGGLALANALATIVESLGLWILLSRRIAGLDERRILSMGLRTLAASLLMGVVVWLVATQLSRFSAPMILIVGAVIGLAVFEGAALLFGVPEARSVPETLLRRFKRK